MNIFLIIIVILYPILLEYFLHRYFMHYPIRGFWDFYERHTLLHHNRRVTHTNIDLPMWFSMFLGLPITILLFLCGYLWMSLIFTVFAALYGYMWTKIHRAIHCVEHNWTEKLFIFNRMKEHHLVHHLKSTKNFGTIFIFSDWIFGSKY